MAIVGGWTQPGGMALAATLVTHETSILERSLFRVLVPWLPISWRRGVGGVETAV